MDNGQDSSNNYIIIIIILRHELGFDRPVSASSNSLFKGLPSRLRPFGLPYFSIIFAILLLFILVTCRSQFDLHFLSFSSADSTFNSSSISSFILRSKRWYPSLLPKNSILIDVNCFLSFFLWSKFRFHIKEFGQPVQEVVKCTPTQTKSSPALTNEALRTESHR